MAQRLWQRGANLPPGLAAKITRRWNRRAAEIQRGLARIEHHLDDIRIVQISKLVDRMGGRAHGAVRSLKEQASHGVDKGRVYERLVTLPLLVAVGVGGAHHTLDRVRHAAWDGSAPDRRGGAWGQAKGARGGGGAVLLTAGGLGGRTGLSDTIRVILRGQLSGDFDPDVVTAEDLGVAMTGAGEGAGEGR